MSKQASLFSFFKKAPGPSPAVDLAPSTQEVAPKTKVDTSEPEVNVKTKETKELYKIKVGSRISIFWPVDDVYYDGTITSYDTVSGQHSVKYDDGQIERVVLQNEKYKLIDDGSRSGVSKSKQTAGAKRGRVIKDDDDDGGGGVNEDEHEWDAESSSAGGAASESSFLLTDDDEDDDDDDDDSFDAESESSPKKRKAKVKSSRLVKNKVVRSKAVTADEPKEKSSRTQTPISVAHMPSSVTPAALKPYSGVKAALSTPKQLYQSTPTETVVVDSHSPDEESGEVGGVFSAGNHEHDTWSFLKENRKDKAGKPVGHPEHNPRTLSVPARVLDEQTPAMRQWFDFKVDNMDTVLFFKVGKFYELFHMDADIGVKEIDLIYMKGYKAHSGFPEISYSKYSNQLVMKGYKVARIEQTETPEMLKERNARKGGKADKVVSREICAILTKGTRTYCHFDEDFDENGDDLTSILIAVKESWNSEQNVCEYGICIVDSIIGKITMAQFEDDTQRSRLRTLVSRYKPSEVLLEADSFTAETLGTFQLLTPRAVIDSLRGSELPSDASSVIAGMLKAEYFPSDSKTVQSGTGRWPAVLQALVAGLVDGSSSLSVCALGAAIWQLKRSCIDFEILSMGKVSAYIPPDVSEDTQKNSFACAAANDEQFLADEGDETHTSQKHMVLDVVSLSNLEVLVTAYDKSEKGSLWGFINRTRTPFGKRLLREWLCKPLFRQTDIHRRSAAVKELMSNLSSEAQQTRILLKGLCDLERLLGRIHSDGSKKRAESHPDSRAIMYETHVYTAKKIKTFGMVLEGYEVLVKVIDVFSASKIASPLLKRAAKAVSDGGVFPLTEMKKLLCYFRSVFDEKQAKRDGTIKPKPGVDEAYDTAKEQIASFESEFEQYLREQKKITGINDLKYFGSNKDRYQIEVPMSLCGKVPSSWISKSQKKTHRRYWNPWIQNKLAQLVDAEERLERAQRDTMRCIFERFSSSQTVWTTAVSCIALLDGLLSLALVSSAPNYCWPEIATKDANRGPLLQIRAGRHPMLEQSLLERGDGEFISNSLMLGGGSESVYIARLLLLSGPNMGGKSTLLRMTCLIVIMAQMGMAVPADACVMTPVDRIFTRVGASDKILEGQSTFFVELAETSNILHLATADSLCILDELGRGTATHDGTAIAHAVVDRLVRVTGCNCLFATHYHSLIDDWGIDPRVQLGHMECFVDHERTRDEGEEVTFLYRLTDGSSPSSYGINVGRLAALPPEVIAMACQQSKDFEDRMKGRHQSLSDEYTGIQHLARDAAVTFFARLVSVVNSEMSSSERYSVTVELWKRFTHLGKSALVAREL